MAAIAWAKVADSEDVWGKHRVNQWTMTLSATAYVAGGFAVTGATFGLRKIAGMTQIAGVPTTGPSAALWTYNATTGKLQGWGTGAADTNLLDEIVSGSLTLTATFLVISTDD